MIRNKDHSRDRSESACSSDGEERMLGVYGRRWLLLFILSMLIFISNWVCFSLSAIETAAAKSYPALNFSLLISIFNISNMIGCLLEPVMLKHYNLRDCIVGAALLMLIGNLLKSLVPGDSDLSITFISIAHFLVGLAQPIFQMTSLVFAQDWFPSTERSFVTAILVNCNQIGIGWAYIGGEVVVGSNPAMIMKYMYMMTASSAVFFFMAFLFFKPLPPLPPSRSAAEKRRKVQAYKPLMTHWIEPSRLLKNKNFNLVLAAFCVSSAAANVISADLSFLLEDDTHSDTSVSVVAATFLGFMVLGSFVVGWHVNKTHAFRETSLVLLVLSALTALLGGVCLGYGLFTGFWFFLLFFGLVAGPGMPLHADLGVEVVYPRDENEVIFVLIIVSNGSNTLLIWLAYLLRNVTYIPYLSLLYVLSFLSALVLVIFGVFFDGQYNRIKFDTEKLLISNGVTPRTVFSM